MRIGKWKVQIWPSGGFALLFHWELNWNDGDEKRIYFLKWEINISNTKPNKNNEFELPKELQEKVNLLYDEVDKIYDKVNDILEDYNKNKKQ